jgi:hypothetical protein
VGASAFHNPTDLHGLIQGSHHVTSEKSVLFIATTWTVYSVSTIEELLERKSRGSGLESLEYCKRDPSS